MKNFARTKREEKGDGDRQGYGESEKKRRVIKLMETKQ